MTKVVEDIVAEISKAKSVILSKLETGDSGFAIAWP